MAISNKTEAQLHYESVKSFLLWAAGILVSGISVIFIIAGILIVKDRADLKMQYQEQKALNDQQLSFYKDQMITMRQDAKDYQKEITDKADKDYSYLKEASARELSSIMVDTRKAALTETQNEVAAEFKTNKIGSIINTQAVKEIKDRLPEILVSETKNLPDIIEAATLFRAGMPSGLVQLKKFIDSGETEYDRNTAKKMFDIIVEKNYNHDLTTISMDLINENLNFGRIDQPFNQIVKNRYPTNTQDIKNLELLMKNINDANAPVQTINAALLILNKILNKKFKLQNLREVNEWYKNLLR